MIEAQGPRRIPDAATHRVSDAGGISAVGSLSGQSNAVDLKIIEPLATGDATIQPPELDAIDRYRAAWAGAIIAIIGAAIVVDLVLVVTVLAGTDDAIAADRIIAGVGAGVGVDLVAVITLLNTSLNMGVTTKSRRTIVETSVGLNLVAIIAGFDAGLHMRIPATRCGAVVETCVGLNLVAVIAGFHAGLDMRIAARRCRTVI